MNRACSGRRTFYGWAALLGSLLIASCETPTSRESREHGFRPAENEIGDAWSSVADPSLVVALSASDSSQYSPGLYLLDGDRLLASWSARSWRSTPGWVPLLFTPPRSNGQPPVVSTTDGLSLALAGSAEHGCPEDDLSLTIRLRSDSEGQLIRIMVQGVPYLVLPPRGTVTVTTGDGETEIDASEFVQEGASIEFKALRSLRLTESDFGPLEVLALSALPWCQLQAHEDFIEVDFDHGCELGEEFKRLELSIEIRRAVDGQSP